MRLELSWQGAYLAFEKPRFHPKSWIHQVWRWMSVILVLGRWTQRYQEFKVIFSYTVNLNSTEPEVCLFLIANDQYFGFLEWLTLCGDAKNLVQDIM